MCQSYCSGLNKDGTFWACVEYQHLHVVIIPDTYPLPHVDDWTDFQGDANFLWPWMLYKYIGRGQSKGKKMESTEFNLDLRICRYSCMSVGTRNALAIFQRALNII